MSSPVTPPPPAALRPYSVLRLYVPAEAFPGATEMESVRTGLNHEALEATAQARELPDLLMSAAERREDMLSRTPVFRTLIHDQRVFVTPEQPEARLPESARTLLQSLGQDVFARIVSPDALEEACSLFDDDDESAADHPSPRYMWAGSACVPISWLLLFAEEDAPAVGPEGLVRVDVRTALRRIRGAILTLSWATLPGEILDELSRTETWLTPHDEGLVELDYGAASRILGHDDSPRDLAVALAALEERDTVTAVAAYRRFEARWHGVRDAILDGLRS